MALPAPNLYPPFNIVRLSHIEYGVTDLAKSRAFYVDTLGLQVTSEADDAIYLRAMEERGHHCIVLRKSDNAEARELGFKVFDETDLDKAARFFDRKGADAPEIEGLTDKSKAKVKQVLIRMLAEAGLLDSTASQRIQRPVPSRALARLPVTLWQHCALSLSSCFSFGT